MMSIDHGQDARATFPQNRCSADKELRRTRSNPHLQQPLPDLPAHTKLPKSPLLLRRRHSRHDVTGQTPDHKCPLLRQIKFLDHQPDNRSKSVPVVKTERRHAVATTAKVNRFLQAHRCGVLRIPQSFGRVMSIGRRFVQGGLRLAEHHVLRRDHLPIKQSQPWPDNTHAQPRLARFALLIFCNSATPVGFK